MSTLSYSGNLLASSLLLTAPEEIKIDKSQVYVVKTGVRVALPEGTYGQIRLEIYGVKLGGGVIDQDYRGEIGVILIGREEPVVIKKDQVIARLEVIKLVDTPLEIEPTGGIDSSTILHPHKTHNTDAGYDVFAKEEITIGVGKTEDVFLGWEIANYDEKCLYRFHSRSGLSVKGILSGGTLFRSDKEAYVRVSNYSNEDFKVIKNMKISQLIIHSIHEKPMAVKPIFSEQLTTTKRGEGGFGSTGL